MNYAYNLSSILTIDMMFIFLYMYLRMCLGALTKNIMAMKERLEGDLPQNEQSGLPIISEAQRRKEREMVTKEVRRETERERERESERERGSCYNTISIFIHRLRNFKPVFRRSARVQILLERSWTMSK